MNGAQNSAVHHKGPDVAGSLEGDELLQVDQPLFFQDAFQPGLVQIAAALQKDYVSALVAEEGLGDCFFKIVHGSLGLFEAGGDSSPGSSDPSIL